MFEIGNSLHEARMRQGLGLQTIETATKIRAKYLKALEDEQFEVLPAETYVKGFLRTYADFLGLDGQLYVDEYSSRFVVGEDDARPLRPRRSTAKPQHRSGRFESNIVLVTLAAIGLVAALVIVAWKSGGNDHQTYTNGAVQTTETHSVTPAVTARLVLTARRGNALLEVHTGSAAGRLLFQGTLLQGKSVQLDGKRLWLIVSEAKNLDAKLNGRRIVLRGGTSIVTPTGVQAG